MSSALPLTSRERLANWRDRCAMTVRTAADAADAVDREARAPTEALAALKASRLLGLLVPTVLGGEGASPTDIGEVCFQLGQACSSTAMIFAMHQIQVACIVRHGGESTIWAEVGRQLAAQQLLLAGSTTEGGRSEGLAASSAAWTPGANGSAVTKSGAVISYAEAADGILVLARRSPDAAPGDQRLGLCGKGQFSLVQEGGWDAMGMRGTLSRAYHLDATAPQRHILTDPFEVVHRRTMLPLAHLFWSSVWAGIAAAAADRARQYARRRASSPDAARVSAEAGRVMEHFEDLRTTITASYQRFERASCDPEDLDHPAVQARFNRLKLAASEKALATVLAALNVLGLAGYMNDSETSVARHLRDICSAPLMISNSRIRATLNIWVPFDQVTRSLDG